MSAFFCRIRGIATLLIFIASSLVALLIGLQLARTTADARTEDAKTNDELSLVGANRLHYYFSATCKWRGLKVRYVGVLADPVPGLKPLSRLGPVDEWQLFRANEEARVVLRFCVKAKEDKEAVATVRLVDQFYSAYMLGPNKRKLDDRLFEGDAQEEWRMLTPRTVLKAMFAQPEE